MARFDVKHALKWADERGMGFKLFAAGLSIVCLTAACSSTEESAPTFQVTSPTLATTSTTAPSTLQYIGVPELSSEENNMCSFVQSVGQDLLTSDQVSQNATEQAKRNATDRTLSEPLRVRMLRDTEVANAQRFANVLKRFDEAASIISSITPGPLTDQATLDQDASDAALLASIGSKLQITIDSTRALNAAEQEAYKQETGRDWVDLFTEDEYEAVLEVLNNTSTGMGREDEAREAMERLDDWSWRHCSAGLTK